MKLIILAFFLITSAYAGTITSLGVSASPNTVRSSSSTYTIIFLFSSATPTDAITTISFPSDYTIPDNSNYPCTLKKDSVAVSSASCSFASNVLTIINFFNGGAIGSDSGISFQVILTGMTNPATNKNSAIVIITSRQDSTIIDTSDSTDSGFQFSFTAASIASISITPLSLVIGNSTIWTFTYTPQYSSPQGSSITIVFPYQNAGLGTTSYIYIISGTPTCASVSNIASSLSCSWTSSTNTLVITGGFPSASVSGSVSFTVTNCLNPPTPSSLSGFTFSLQSSSGGTYESSSTLSVTATSPNSITITDGWISATTTTISSSTTMSIKFTGTNPFVSGDIVEVTFPSQIAYTSSSINVYGYTGFSTYGVKLTVTAYATNVIRLSGGFTGYVKNAQYLMSFTTVTLPTSTQPTDQFTIRHLTSSGVAVDTGTGGRFAATAGTMLQDGSNAWVTASVYTVGASSIYYFDFLLAHSLPSGAALSITFPSSVTIASASSSACSYILSGMTSANCVVSSKMFNITDGFPSGASPKVIKIGVDGVTNPLTTSPASSFVITSYTDNTFQYMIDTTSTTISITCQAAALASVTVTPSSFITGDTATYTFTIVTTTQIPSGGSLIVNLPATVAIASGSITNAQNSCSKLSGFNTNSFSCTCTTSKITVVNGFQSGIFAGGGTLSFSVSYITNPSSTKKSSSFSITTYDGSSYAIDTLTSGIFVTMTIANTLQNAIITPTSLINGASTTYTVCIMIKNPTNSGCVVNVFPPSEVTFPSSPTCASAGTSTVTSVSSCAKSGTGVSVALVLSSDPSATGTWLNFTVASITNPPSTQTTSTFTVYTLTSDGYSIDKQETGITVTTTTAATITDIYISAGDSKITSTTYYTISYAPVNIHPTGTTITVIIPSEFTVSSATCSYGSSLSSDFLCVVSGNTVITNGGFATPLTSSSRVTFTITGIVNPNSQTSTSAWSITSKVGSYLIDASNSIKSGFTCTLPCTACQSSPTYCTACDSTSTHPYLWSNACNTACKDGFYDDITTPSDKSCSTCDGKCKTCQDYSTYCLTCDTTGSYPYFSSNSCVGTCPSGTAPSSYNCVSCNSPCKYCSATVDTCTSCISNYYLYGTTCTNKCIDGYVGVGTDCVQCSGCATCSGSTTYCTSCGTGLFLYANTCDSSCPANTYVPGNGVCNACDPNCATCSGTITTCKSCWSGFKLYGNTCVTNCPADITVDNGTSCTACSSNCAKCSSTDINVCTGCTSPFPYLQEGVCVDSCYGGYILSGTNCLKCNSVCYSCSIATANCTTCPSNTYLLNNWCYSACPNGYTVSLGTCVLITNSANCAPNCTPALVENTSCESDCNVAACNYDNGMCNQGTTTCQSGYYLEVNTCKACSYPCNSCTGPSTCINCAVSQTTGSTLIFYNAYCYDNCPAGTLSNGLVCTDCNIKCASCQGTIDTCLTCASNLYLYNNDCLANCPADTTIVSVVGTDKQCVDCDSNCLYCSGTTSTCTKCSADKVLQGTVCRLSCNSGWTAISSTCTQCVGCTECSGTVTTCTACDSSLYLYNSQCVSKCPDKTYAYGNICQSCDSTCVTCVESGSCLTCTSDTVKYGSLCLSNCPASYTNSSGTCTLINIPADCVTGCTSTLLANTICDGACRYKECNYDNGYCSNNVVCSVGEYYDGSSCLSCSYPCLACNSTSTCVSCTTSQVNTGVTMLYYMNYCYDTCPPRTMQVGLICEDCDSSCLSCYGSTTTCISCDTGKYLYEGTCVNDCPADITIKTGTVCDSCSLNCATCSGSYDYCTSCAAGKVAQNGKCQASCDTGYTVTNSSPAKCLACTGGCITCSAETYYCTSCDTGKYLQGTSCVSSCTTGTYVLVGDTCLACTNNCATCQTTTDTCLSCVNGYSLYSSACWSTCPTGYESISGVCTQECAEGCTQLLLNNGACDTVCNTAACVKDNGNCVQNVTCVNGQYQSGNNCLSCVYPCNTCQTAAFCTSCQISSATSLQLYLYQGTCKDACPITTYQNGLICSDCPTSCDYCSSSTVCTTCTGSLVVYNGGCVSDCPSQYTATTAQPTVCSQCSASCKDCSGTINHCTSCNNGYTLTASNTCISNCADGTTLVGSTCETCVSPCVYCNGAVSSCTSCIAGLVLQGSSCVTCTSPCKTCSGLPTYCLDCIESYYLSGTTCLPCNANCNTCIDYSYKCDSCADGKFLSGTSCLTCDSSCATCSGTSTTCTTCSNSKFLDSGKCYSCDTSCKTCDTAYNHCTSCNNHYYLTATYTCQVCSSTCDGCYGSDTYCTSCISPLTLLSNTCGTCLASCATCSTDFNTCATCPTGKTLISGKCDSCLSSCATCVTDFNTCATCPADKFLVNGACVGCSSECATCQGSSTYCTACTAPLALISNQCVVCDASCLTCSGTTTTCTTCPSGLNLFGSQCLACTSNCKTCSGSQSLCASCDDGYYLTGTTCIVCNTNCLTCSISASNCLSCAAGYSLIDGLCKQVCGDGYYLNGLTCYPCNSNCKTCIGTDTSCTSCYSGFIYNSACVTSCPIGAFYSSAISTCDTCYSLCKECQTTSTHCISCNAGYSLATSNNTCNLICGAGTYYDGSQCKSCSTNCATCYGSPTYCTSCSYANQTLTSSGFCQTPCGQGYIQLVANGDCVKCDSSCNTCSGTTVYCTACADTTKYLYKGVCYTTCPSPTTVASGNTCVDCTSPCSTCQTTAIYCLSCISTYYLYQNTCQKSCPSTYTAAIVGGTGVCLAPCSPGYVDPSGDGNCVVCDTTCKTCSVTTTNCTACTDSTAYLYDGSCLSKCPDLVSVAVGNVCKACSLPCATCSTTVSNCLSCITSNYLYEGTCSTTCPDGYTKGTQNGSGVCLEACTTGYIRETPNGNCVACNSDCSSCYGKVTNCTACADSTKYLYGGSCVKTCPTNTTVAVGKNCEDCSSPCLTCKSTINSCLSCVSGYYLYQSTCVQTCPTGYTPSTQSGTGVCLGPCTSGYVRNGDTGNCDACDTACKTCSGTTSYCSACTDSTLYLYQGSCVSACPADITITLGNTCVSCESPCLTCNTSTTYCKSCTSGKYLYTGACYDSCPKNITVAESQTCVACASPCQNCTSSKTNCISCISNYFLFENTCVLNCPDGYNQTGSTCVECPNLDCGNGSKLDNSTSSSTFNQGPVPFPFSGFTVVSGGILVVTKFTASGVGLVNSLISTWSISAAASWIFLGAFIFVHGGDSPSRRLLAIDPTSGSLMVSIVLLLIIGALAFHYICNFSFMAQFFVKTCRKDPAFKYWRKKHKWSFSSISTCATFLTFHSIRLLYSGMCNSLSFKAMFDNKGKVYKSLIKFGYVSLLCTHIPLIIAQGLLLGHYEISEWMWMFSLDSLIVTILLTILIFWDIKSMEKDLLRHEWEKELGPLDKLEGQSLVNPNNTISELMQIFPVDFSGILPQKVAPIKRKKLKYKSKSTQPSRASSPVSERLYHRKNSFPLLEKDGVEVDLDFLRKDTLPKILDEPIDESNLLDKMRENSLLNANDLTVLPEEDTKGEFEKSKKEYKNPIYRPTEQNYVPLNFNPIRDEWTEVVAYTERDSEPEEIEPNIEDEEILVEEEKVPEPIPPIESPTKSPNHYGTIEAENELDFDKAFVDSNDPEIVSVPHKPTGGRVRVRKDFKGARIVDLENKVIDNAPPIDPSKYDIPKTIVDENDVRYATLVSHSGEKVRVHRNFRGARIVDLEKKVNHPHAYLIGQSVKNESDFQFNNAYPDPEDPEVVVVMHNETGEDVKVRKTFHGAAMVDEHGNLIPNQPLIDRNDYDIGKTIVDKEDVHIATLSHKKTNARVKVRRDFRGAKIIDLERKAELPIGRHNIFSKNEPEPLSPNGSDLDFKILDRGWMSPAHPEENPYNYSRKPPRPQRTLNFGQPKEGNPDRTNLETLAEIIQQEEKKGSRSDRKVFTHDYKNQVESEGDEPSFDSFGNEFMVPISHNLDLEYPIPPDYDFQNQGMLEMNESVSSINSRNPRRRRKFKKKQQGPVSSRMRQMEEIYLQRLEPGPRREPRTQFREDMDEPEFEQWDQPDSGFERARGSERTLSSAGDEIVRGARRLQYPQRRDF